MLAAEGFYNGQQFHRIVPDFVAQIGDPKSKNGMDGPGVGQRRVEVRQPAAGGEPRLQERARHPGDGAHERSAIRPTASFTSCSRDAPHLDMQYTVFGKVLDNGMDRRGQAQGRRRDGRVHRQEVAAQRCPPLPPMTSSPAQPFQGSKVLILDFGSQYTQVIARRVRECSVYSQIVRFDTPAAELARDGRAGDHPVRRPVERVRGERPAAGPGAVRPRAAGAGDLLRRAADVLTTSAATVESQPEARVRRGVPYRWRRRIARCSRACRRSSTFGTATATR